ncbi:HpcH/HpaI aldolase/citrate lyase family protein [Psychromarinibacter sp. C21-152]|uniref:Hydroxypyruvate/pyruvate aldolase n=1 Tax=Psychromarinibacter sediminicola TaxID=3033385 RepID=A0AAE3NVH0_9RHOB|nr:HpcH/HpaI aldolase/citrate lyase family protein [Psychromarinibacter sediminicola]MDF0602877.1 HpcH/HpaI aldolase/citrate lyase family protein [Psychromarinibacter sediminicola]
MDLPRNHFKAAIMAGTPQIGLWCSIPDPTMTEMLAGCGYDWMMIDTEHSPMDPLVVQPMLQAAAAYPVSTLVRPTALDPAQIKKFLDAGAQTVMVPYVQTKEEAELAVASVTYPPDGIRGVAGVTRASRFGAVKDYATRAREEICLIVQIETKGALDRLEEIAGVPGVDAVFVGPADMAASLGYAGQNGHPEVRKACADAIRRIRALGKPAGFLSPDDSLLEEMTEAGSVFTAVDLDTTILRRGALARAKAWKDRVG